MKVDLTPEDTVLLKQVPGYETFDPRYEVLSMKKAVYGLKDSPRDWRKRLHQALCQFGLQPLKAEAELYVRHLVPRSGNARGNSALPSKAQTKLASMHAPEKANSREGAAQAVHLPPLAFPDLEIILSAFFLYLIYFIIRFPTLHIDKYTLYMEGSLANIDCETEKMAE